MMKVKRNERVGVIIKLLSDNPGRVFTLNYFSDKLQAAKSTICEDIGIVKKIMENFDLGLIQTITGASGGVVYKPVIKKKYTVDFLKDLCMSLKMASRIIPGGYLYVNDIIYNPYMTEKIGNIMAQPFLNQDIDFVITVETKGITVATMTARALNIPLVVARRENKVTEGSVISINYLSGSSKRIQTMSLSKRAVKQGSRALIVDDFMKAGGTARGLIDLLDEFNVTVKGVSVLISTNDPVEKLVKDYYSLLKLNNVDEQNKIIDIEPGII